METNNNKALQLLDANDIIALDLPPVQFVVEKFLPHGLSLLASPPKYGKSWFVMDLCISVVNGTEFLGFQTNQSECIYFALEDSVNRYQSRLKKILNDKQVNKGFYGKTTLPNMDNGLVEILTDTLKSKPEIKLVVFDTLQKIRGSQEKGEGAYAYDYREMGVLKQIADKYKIAILLVHHLAKKDDSDIFNKISGTNGIMGSVDTMFALSKKSRGSEQTTLTMTGRDVEYNDFLITFNKQTCKWELQGDADVEEEKRELQQYKDNPLTITINKLVEHHGGIWKGTATDIMEYAAQKLKLFIDGRPNELGRSLTKIKNKLYNVDKIIWNEPASPSAKGRIHTFQKVGYSLYTYTNNTT